MANDNHGVTPEQREQRHESRTNSKFITFVRDLGDLGNWSEEQAVRHCAVVLAHLEQRLTGNQTRKFEAQLPLKLQEMLSVVPKSPEGKPAARLHKDDFIDAVASDLQVEGSEAESIVRTVFAGVRAWISEGEAGHVEDELPRDMKHLWAMPV